MILAFIIGALTGALSGAGIGGGTLLMLYLTALAKVPQAEAQGTNLLYYLPCSAAALVSHIKNGLTDKRVAIPAIAAGLVTTLIAAFFATSMDAGLLRKIFGGFLIAIGGLELFRKG